MRITGLFVAAIPVALLSIMPVASVSAQTDPVVTDPSLLAEIALAETLGKALHAYDQAAWHSTDALFEAIDVSSIDNPKGYVVVPRDGDDLLDTIFIAEQAGELREFARFTVKGSTVVSGGLVKGEPPQLSLMARRMFEARFPAFEAFAAKEYNICSDTPPNSLTLPPNEQDAITFYMLTSTIDTNSYPLGGHYRADVSVDGTVADTRRYMNSCYDLPLTVPSRPDAEDGRPGISYLFGDTPSEIHVFASYQFPGGFFVITDRNDALWLVEQGEISLAQENFTVDSLDE